MKYWVEDGSLYASPRFIDEYEGPEVSKDGVGEVEAGARAAAAEVLAALTTVAIVVGTAAGGVEVVVGCWMNSASATCV
jgi:hypothetical protein